MKGSAKKRTVMTRREQNQRKSPRGDIRRMAKRRKMRQKKEMPQQNMPIQKSKSIWKLPRCLKHSLDAYLNSL